MNFICYDRSCSLYNSNHTNYIEIRTQRIVGLQAEGFFSVIFKSSEIFLLVKTGCNTWTILLLRSLSCLRTESADFWSLKGKVINTGLSTGLVQLWFWSWVAWNVLKIDQKSADSVRRQLSDLSNKIDCVLQPVFTSRKISEDLKITETKPSLVNQQCVVYEFQCHSCDSNYIGYTSGHLHLHIEEYKYSVIGEHLKD